MTLDLSPYDAATEAYQEAERDALIVRMIQSLPEGRKLTEAELEVGLGWMIRFQQARDTMAIVLKGLAKVHIQDGEVGLQAAMDGLLGPLDAVMGEGGIDQAWLEEHLELEGPTPPEQR